MVDKEPKGKINAYLSDWFFNYKMRALPESSPVAAFYSRYFRKNPKAVINWLATGAVGVVFFFNWREVLQFVPGMLTKEDKEILESYKKDD
ncbi:MAG: hypothetical protein MHPSP_001047 [Paramarteilia canceri]